MWRMAATAAATLGLLVAAPAPARADAFRYAATWGGLPAAEIYLAFDEQPLAHYRTGIEVRTLGLPKFLTKFIGNGVSEGDFAVDGALVPARYDVRYDLRKRRDRRISLRFVAADGARMAERGPEDGSKKRQLAPEFRRDVLDPLGVLTIMRTAIRDGRVAPGAAFRLAAFDGKRRFDVEGRHAGTESLIVAGRAMDVARVELLLRPVAGFDDEDEGEDVENRTRPAVLHFSADRRAVPVRAEVKIALLPVVISFAGECSATGCPAAAADAKPPAQARPAPLSRSHD